MGTWILSALAVGASLTSPSTDFQRVRSLSASELPIAAEQGAMNISVNIANNATVSGEIKFVVKVDAKDPVTQVEFYVGDNIRDTDSSTPYEFTIDTLAEADGPLKVTFAAYTTEGQNVKKILTLSVDNGLSKGAEYHVSQGRDFNTQGKFDDAIRCGRTALKIDAKNNGARMVLARAFFAKNVLDSAQKFAEDALTDNPKLFEAADLLSGIHLKRAFTTFNQGGDRNQTLDTIAGALKAAVESRRKVLDANLDGFGTVHDANRIAYADLAMKAGRYSVAIKALNDRFKIDSSDPALGNRLVYSQMRSARFDDAVATLTAMKRSNALDGFSNALWSILEVIRGNDQAADDQMKEAILTDPDLVGIQTAQAWIALRRNRVSALQNLATRLASDAGQKSEAQYYLEILNFSRGNFSESQKAFERALLAEPTNYDMYVQRGNEALAIVIAKRGDTKELAYQTKAAEAYFETALVAKPDSAEALTGMALSRMSANKKMDALRFARGAVGAAPAYGAGHYVLAMTLSKLDADERLAISKIRSAAPGGNLSTEQMAEVNRRTKLANDYGKEAMAEMKLAEQTDAVNLRGRGIPDLPEAFGYFARSGRLPLLVAPL